MSALTRDEHEARAMLLGRQYRPHFHAYRDGSKPGGESYIDADTLEPLPYGKVLERITDTLGEEPKEVNEDIAADFGYLMGNR